jgi:hypothetical protein
MPPNVKNLAEPEQQVNPRRHPPERSTGREKVEKPAPETRAPKATLPRPNLGRAVLLREALKELGHEL